MSFRYFDPHSFGRGFTVNNILDNYSSPGPGSYNPQLINRKSKNNDYMFRKKTSRKIKKSTNKENNKKLFTNRLNYEPCDFYNVQEKYINESKKPTIPKYSFGKASRIEYNKKKKNNNISTIRPKSAYLINKNFEEEKNNVGDNHPNNIKFEMEKLKGDNCQNSNNKINKNKEQEQEENGIPGVGKYNLRGSLTVPVVKFGTEKKGLNYDNIVSPGPAKYNLREKEYGKTNTRYTIPKGPRGIQQRPFTPGPGKYDPLQKLTKENSLKYSFPKERRLNYVYNSNPGPNKYNTTNKFGKDAKKISMSPFGRKPPKYNDFPGPNKYNPNYKVLKTKYPKYRIGTAKRMNLYDTNTFPAPNRYYTKDNYNSKRPKSPTWKIGTGKRPPLYRINKTPGVGIYSLRNNRNDGPKYTFGLNNKIKNKEKRPGVGQYNVGKSSIITMKKEPRWKIGKSSRDDLLTNDKRGNPGPGMYCIPCSIVDVNEYTREKGKFDENFRYI